MSTKLLNNQFNIDDILKNNDYVDNTEHIRKVRHSYKIEADISTFISLKKKYTKLKRETFENMCMHQCSFLHTNYTDIYNKLLKDELDLQIFNKFITILRKIENGEEDQHTASVMIGTILKELYIDSALKRTTKIEEKQKQKEKNASKSQQSKKVKFLKTHNPEKYNKENLSWKDYKNSI